MRSCQNRQPQTPPYYNFNVTMEVRASRDFTLTLSRWILLLCIAMPICTCKDRNKELIPVFKELIREPNGAIFIHLWRPQKQDWWDSYDIIEVNKGKMVRSISLQSRLAYWKESTCASCSYMARLCNQTLCAYTSVHTPSSSSTVDIPVINNVEVDPVSQKMKVNVLQNVGILSYMAISTYRGSVAGFARFKRSGDWIHLQAGTGHHLQVRAFNGTHYSAFSTEWPIPRESTLSGIKNLF
ncbi:unnamed protein product [Dicrocoelium dendriticum]|nr:unnamed protein product [Dicrocoelium dendriticum]